MIILLGNNSCVHQTETRIIKETRKNNPLVNQRNDDSKDRFFITIVLRRQGFPSDLHGFVKANTSFSRILVGIRGTLVRLDTLGTTVQIVSLAAIFSVITQCNFLRQS